MLKADAMVCVLADSLLTHVCGSMVALGHYTHRQEGPGKAQD